MKTATRSNDGTLRFTYQVQFRIGLAEMAIAVALKFWYEDEEPPASLSRSTIERTTRDALWREGAEYFSFGAEKLGDQQDAAEQWAKGIVLKAFPELKE